MRRHFERTSATVTPGVSSIRIFASPTVLNLSAILSISVAPSSPVRSFCMLTPDSEAMIRMTTCSLLISRLNTATVAPSRMAAWAAILRANADLPVAGRPAIIIRSLRWSPLVSSSRSISPVAMPVRRPRFCMYSPIWVYTRE